MFKKKCSASHCKSSPSRFSTPKAFFRWVSIPWEACALKRMLLSGKVRRSPCLRRMMSDSAEHSKIDKRIPSENRGKKLRTLLQSPYIKKSPDLSGDKACRHHSVLYYIDLSAKDYNFQRSPPQKSGHRTIDYYPPLVYRKSAVITYSIRHRFTASRAVHLSLPSLGLLTALSFWKFSLTILQSSIYTCASSYACTCVSFSASCLQHSQCPFIPASTKVLFQYFWEYRHLRCSSMKQCHA